MRPDQDEEKASKSGLPAMFTQNYQNAPMILAMKISMEALV